MKSIAQWEEKTDLLKFLNQPEGRGRIHAIFDITGGNHRLLVTFYNFLKIDYKNDLSYSFIKTINDLIPYYQSYMNLLSAQQQKIIQYLCQNRKPSSVKDIAENCFSTPNTISKQVSTLEKLKYVDAAPVGKETFYELSEPLLRICFEVKENRGGPIKLFIDFLGNLYTVQEASFLKARELDEKNSLLMAQLARNYAIEGNYKKSQIYIKKVLIENPGNSYILNYIGEIHRETERFETAITFYNDAIKVDSNNHWAYFNIVSCRIGLNDIEKALSQLEQALNLAKEIKLPWPVIQNFQENYTTLFIHGSKKNISTYLRESLLLIERYGYIEELFKALPHVLFKLLSQHEKIESNRFEWIEILLNETFKDNPAMTTALKFLNIGIRHLKKKEKNALFQFTKEERKTFQEFVLDRINKIAH